MPEALARDRAGWQRRLEDLVAAARTIARRVLQRIERPPAPGPVPLTPVSESEVKPTEEPRRTTPKSESEWE